MNEQVYRQQAREIEEKILQLEKDKREKNAANKKLEEEKRKLELIEAGKQAFKDRQEMKARVQARLNEPDQKRLAEERE